MGKRTTALGAEIQEFYENGWPHDDYVREAGDDLYDEAENWLLEPGKSYNLNKVGGVLSWCNHHESPPKHLGEHPSFAKAFNAWLDSKAAAGKEQVVINAWVPAGQGDRLRALVEKFLKETP